MPQARLSVAQTQHIYDPQPEFVHRSSNPFGEEEPSFEPTAADPVVEQQAQPNPLLGLIDLDNLHLGDGYSPMVA